MPDEDTTKPELEVIEDDGDVTLDDLDLQQLEELNNEET